MTLGPLVVISSSDMMVKDSEVMEMVGLLMSREGKIFLLSGVVEDVYLTCLSP